MRNVYCLIACALFLLSGSLTSQTIFSKLPRDFQMFPRDQDNRGWFSIAGICDRRVESLLAVLATEPRDSVWSQTEIIPDRDGSFEVQLSIPSRLTQYILWIREKQTNGHDSVIMVIRHLVAGDFFLIAGQSNAEASGPYDSLGAAYERSYSHPACRGIGASFGYATGDGRLPISDDSRMGWPGARHAVWGNYAFVNTWGMKLQYEMAERTGIPSCFVNAARGGLSLLECLPSRSPLDAMNCRHSSGTEGLALPYDRAYTKLHMAGATGHLRGIFWYQGEAEGMQPADSAKKYGHKFAKLYEAWQKDYPAVKKIIVMQVGIGCGGPSHQLVAEIQRKLPLEFENVALMSVHGYSLSQKNPDNCHYTVEGYGRLGNNLLASSLHYFYDFPLSRTSDKPADAFAAQYTTPHDLLVEFDIPVHAQQSTNYPDSTSTLLKQIFYDQDGAQVEIDSVESKENYLILHLRKGSRQITELTYLPGNYSSYGVYAGPWILNAANPALGALGFYRIPVKPFRERQGLSPDAAWPNPAGNVLNLSFADMSDRRIVILDAFGTEKLEVFSHGEEKLELDISELDRGFHILRIENDDKVVYSRFLRQ